jgi:hypothetical protein
MKAGLWGIRGQRINLPFSAMIRLARLQASPAG